MENVICSCIKCEAELGCFRNSWNQIGNTYYSPIYPPASALDGFVATNSIYKGSENTQIENSYLQDIVCKECGALLGLRCDSAPEGHLLKRDQLILRLAEMAVISERSGKKATASVIERFPLMLPGTTKPPRAARASTVQPSYRTATPNYVNNRHTVSSFLPPVDDRQLRELDVFKDWAKDAIQSQQNDIVRIGGAVDRMEKDLKSFKIFMEEIRAEFVTQRQLQDGLKNEEFGVIKQDLHAIQAELHSNRQFKNSLKEEEFPVLQQDMDAFRSELAQARNFQRELKDQDIKNLQRDVHGLRNRLEEFAYLTIDSPKVSQAEFETLVDDVREVDRKSNEIYALRTELGQFEAQLESMRIAVDKISSREAEADVWRHVPGQAIGAMSQNENRFPGTAVSRQSIRNNMERVHQSLVKGGEENHSVPKRRHFEIENNISKSQGPPTKKRPIHTPGKHSTILSPENGTPKSLAVPFRSKDSPIILSSNHGTPSPILDKYSVQSVQKGGEVISRSMNRPTDFTDLDSPLQKFRPIQKPLSTGDIDTSNAQRPSGTPNTVFKDTIGNSTGTRRMGTGSSRPHHTSAYLNQAQKPGERPHKVVKATSSKENTRHRNFRQRSDTPDQLSILSGDETIQKSTLKRKSGSTSIRNSKAFGSSAIAPKDFDFDSPLPSIEGEARQGASKLSVVIPTIPSPPPAQDHHADPERPFPCEECGKNYKFAANLERHKVISNRCRGNESGRRIGNAEEQTSKKRKLGERERLAAELLVRQ